MMNFTQLSELIKQGFTEDQIRAVYNVMGRDTDTHTNTNTPTSTPTSTPTPAAATIPGQSSTSAQAGSSAPTATQESTTPPASAAGGQNPAESETVTLLKEMLGLIRKGNIDTMGGGVTPEPDASDVLAEILNPTPKK